MKQIIVKCCDECDKKCYSFSLGWFCPYKQATPAIISSTLLLTDLSIIHPDCKLEDYEEKEDV